jgi:hypothetical protein
MVIIKPNISLQIYYKSIKFYFESSIKNRFFTSLHNTFTFFSVNKQAQYIGCLSSDQREFKGILKISLKVR